MFLLAPSRLHEAAPVAMGTDRRAIYGTFSFERLALLLYLPQLQGCRSSSQRYFRPTGEQTEAAFPPQGLSTGTGNILRNCSTAGIRNRFGSGVGVPRSTTYLLKRSDFLKGLGTEPSRQKPTSSFRTAAVSGWIAGKTDEEVQLLARRSYCGGSEPATRKAKQTKWD